MLLTMSRDELGILGQLQHLHDSGAMVQRSGTGTFVLYAGLIHRAASTTDPESLPECVSDHFHHDAGNRLHHPSRR